MVVLASLLATVLLRTEGAFFVGGLALALALIGPPAAPPGLRLALAAVMTSWPWSARSLEAAWSASLGGTSVGAIDPEATVDLGYLSGRISVLAFSWLLPGYRGPDPGRGHDRHRGDAPSCLGTWLVRRRPQDPGAIVVPVLGGVPSWSCAGSLEWGPVPGLLLAACVIAAGLTLMSRRSEGTPVCAPCWRPAPCTAWRSSPPSTPQEGTPSGAAATFPR